MAPRSRSRFGVTDDSFRLLYEEAELHGAAETAGEVSHRKGSGL